MSYKARIGRFRKEFGELGASPFYPDSESLVRLFGLVAEGLRLRPFGGVFVTSPAVGGLFPNTQARSL